MTAWPERTAPMPMPETARHSVYEKGNELSGSVLLLSAILRLVLGFLKTGRFSISTHLIPELERISRFNQNIVKE